jgi:16S rRNA C1402 N4-methylase RsmH
VGRKAKPTDAERSANPRSRSATLRVIERVR